ncbi:Zinc finger MYM-type protein 1 [Frankliniella fusca]|uniref:Zinc finger MYM-type protein 1 n=1 Tax=Frankliniella fusca TaxID=407009 RepID=A0AAE1LLP9_9NEOP|nr:Zinc finger MYM-type protein 1 [Frankliniella fusca]
MGKEKKQPKVRGKYSKYAKHYNKDWEKEPEFKGFVVKSNESKVKDLILSAHVACHSSVRTIDHLGEVINTVISKHESESKSSVPPLKLHRTKCSKIICKVISPCLQRDLVKDVGEGWFTLIIDESTDTTTLKHLALMIKYYSHKDKCMILDYLGIVETPECSADILYNVIKDFLKKIGLNIKKLFSLGTDGAANLCGANHSVFALLKKNDCPNLHLVKCVCHGLDKCASKASAAFPASLEYLIRESRNWFSHSALRKVQYEREYKALIDGQKPPVLVKLATTRWLSWYGAVKSHSLQYFELQSLFRKAADADPERKKCPMAHQLAALHEDGAHLLYLAFLKPILRELASINTLFQSSSADVAVVYRDLKAFVFTIANAVVKPEAIRQTQPGGMLRLSEIQALKISLLRPENFKSRDLVDYGEGFWKVAADLKLPQEKMDEVQRCCKDFLVKFTHELVNRLPSCIEAIDGMRAFTPSIALASRGRPQFKQLPLKLVSDNGIDMEAMEMQWKKLGNMKFEEICPGKEESVDIVTFWGTVYDLKNAAGQQVFPDLARFVLAALTLPLSNAIVERLFSVLGIVKCKLRNRLSMEMLDALLRIRTHFHARGKCCNQFKPTTEMVDNFNSKCMYASSRSHRHQPEAGGSRSNTDDFEEWEIDNPEEVHDESEIAVGLSLEDGDIDASDSGRNPVEYDEIFDVMAELDIHLID